MCVCCVFGSYFNGLLCKRPFGAVLFNFVCERRSLSVVFKHIEPKEGRVFLKPHLMCDRAYFSVCMCLAK